MSPTLQPSDQFLVCKLLQPRRFDLVACYNPSGGAAVHCKRLIGLPGDRVRFEGGGIFINDQPQQLPALLEGRCHAEPGYGSIARRHDGQTMQLASDEYFVIGDNIEIARDSRSDGPSHRSDLVGVVDWIYWPPSRMRLFR